MIVIKRDGREVKFEKKNIFDAIMKAIDATENSNKIKNPEAIAETIAERLRYRYYKRNRALSVEEIQDDVEKEIAKEGLFPVAKTYILYRENRSREREKKSALMKGISEKIYALNVENQNANVDERSFGGKMGAANSEVMKKYALDYIIPETDKANHLNNEIYIHDLDHYAVGDHNCLSIPFDELLSRGFNTRQTDVRPANSINTAFQLVAVIFQLQSLQQFGGVSATHLDWTMVPYVRKSFWKHYKDGVEFFGGDLVSDVLPIDHDDYKCQEQIYNYAMKMTKRELTQAAEGLFHNLNTLQSRSGNQLPFTSINFGTCTLPEGRMVTKALLNASINGVGKFHKTPIFPCSIFQCMKGVNREPGDPNYDLFKLALQSTAQRLYPNYANCDWSGNAGYDKNDPRTFFSTMGLA